MTYSGLEYAVHKSILMKIKLGNRHTRGSARTTNARGRSTRGLTSEPVPSAIMSALPVEHFVHHLLLRRCMFVFVYTCQILTSGD